MDLVLSADAALSIPDLFMGLRWRIWNSLIGRAVSREFLQTDCEDEIRSAMLVNPYISDVTDFNVERKDDQMHISFRVITRFGEMEVEQSV